MGLLAGPPRRAHNSSQPGQASGYPSSGVDANPLRIDPLAAAPTASPLDDAASSPHSAESAPTAAAPSNGDAAAVSGSADRGPPQQAAGPVGTHSVGDPDHANHSSGPVASSSDSSSEPSNSSGAGLRQDTSHEQPGPAAAARSQLDGELSGSGPDGERSHPHILGPSRDLALTGGALFHQQHC